MSAAKQKADAFKDQGNALFKEGKMLEASKLYAKAEAAAPNENVYPANLSAALYEMGDYAGSLDAIARSWKLSSANTGLTLRLATRAAKALAHGVRGGTITPSALAARAQIIGGLEAVALQQEKTDAESSPESVRVWHEWRAVESENGNAQDARVRLAEMSIARCSVNPMLQYYPVGQDEMLSLFDDWGPRDPYPLKISTFSKTSLSELSFLFGGVGDARNVFATLIGAHRAYKGLPKDKRSVMRVHLTLLDIHPSALARDLVVLMLLNDWMTPGLSPAALAETQATLMYTYAGAIMPPYAHARQQKTIKSLQEQLTVVPPLLPAWLHVNASAIPALQASLTYWLNNTSKTTRGMLAMFPADGGGSSMVQLLKFPGLSPSYRALIKGKIDAPLRAINGAIDSWGPAQARTFGVDGPGWDDARVMRELAKRREGIAEDLLEEHLSGNAAPKLTGESAWFKATKGFVPPKELWGKHPEMEQWRKNRKGPYPEEVKAQVKSTVEKSWKPNMTLFDREYSELSDKSLPHCKGYPDVRSDNVQFPRLCDVFNRRFGIDKGGELPADPESPAFTHMMRFFQGAMDALRSFEGKVTLEIMCGGLMQELDKMRLGTDGDRPAQFPRSFTRAYLSNIPDYTHGVINTATYVVPSLQQLPGSAVASNCLMNSGVWKDNDEFCHNYALLHPRDVPRFLGCDTIRMDGIMGLVSLAKTPLPRPLAELATRAELTRWLTRVLLYTCVPGSAGMQNARVRMPNNLVAFVRLLVHLHAVGYPAHWLSEFLQPVLADELVTEVAPYLGQFPIPLSDLGRSGARRRVRLDAWLPELEGILASAATGLPFAVSVPKGWATTHGEITVFEAVVQPKAGGYGQIQFAVQDPVVDILLYKPSKTLSVEALARSITGIMDSGKAAEPRRGSVVLLSSQEGVDVPGRKVSWRLSRARAKVMRDEGWAMVVYRTDNHEAMTLPLPASRWMEVLEVLDVD
ncbi:hypothetical protein C8R47DRAFT_116012 [Mycena vitilis]|nr:hypothetical protein C8R47DRAFT_116012 [Mycena vitilis]